MPEAALTCCRPTSPDWEASRSPCFDDAGGTGDATGQPTYDMFNMPLTNSLAGTIDPVTGMDACPISQTPTHRSRVRTRRQKGVVGMIVTCPKYESDGITLSPMAGQAIVNNLIRADTAWSPRRALIALHVAKNGCRPTRWTARRHTIRSCVSASRPTSRSSARLDTT